MRRMIYDAVSSCDACPYTHLLNSGDKIVFKCLKASFITENPDDLDNWFNERCPFPTDETSEQDIITAGECM